jgi:L-amino acid N-acyltransferase YncA
MTIVGYEISLATSADVDGILGLQEENLSHRGGMLSVALSREWFERTLSEMPIIVTRNEARMVGFLVSSSFAAFAKVAVIESMLGVYCGDGDAYIYGPICVAHGERGRGLALRMFAALRAQLPGREGILFIRRDNEASLKAHIKMGIREVGEFTHRDVVHTVLAYTS